jgi:hypothetical protein
MSDIKQPKPIVTPPRPQPALAPKIVLPYRHK